MPNVRCLTAPGAALGESPVWSAAEGCIYWVDITGRKLHRTDPAPADTQSWPMPGLIGMCALRRAGGLIVALADGLYGFDPATEGLDYLTRLEAPPHDNRPNDGKCDAAGRLWVGTMSAVDESVASGGLYRVDPDLTVTEIERPLGIPNGLAWSPDDRTMYHTDTGAGVVRSWIFDANAGSRAAPMDFFSFDWAVSGGVDGAAMDCQGGYWAALYGGGKLIRVMPDGVIEREISLPVSQPTMPAFGGSEMKTLFVTSAAQNLGAASLKAQPEAGALFAVDVDIAGHAVHAFAG